jgi:hypothetical protein
VLEFRLRWIAEFVCRCSSDIDRTPDCLNLKTVV